MNRLILTCEHGGNRVPPDYAALFRSRRAQQALNGHRGIDRGALDLAVRLAAALDAPLISSTVTRLLIDLNRSLHHRRLLSEFSRGLDREARQDLIALFYTPHRQKVECAIEGAIEHGAVVFHVAVHSFTPRLGGRERNADVGLLYDPGRETEQAFCVRWQRNICALGPGLRVRRNYPYLGKTDGLTTAMRRLFAPSKYRGIELELNQRLLGRAPEQTAQVLAQALTSSLAA